MITLTTDDLLAQIASVFSKRYGQPIFIWFEPNSENALGSYINIWFSKTRGTVKTFTITSACGWLYKHQPRTNYEQTNSNS